MYFDYCFNGLGMLKKVCRKIKTQTNQTTKTKSVPNLYRSRPFDIMKETDMILSVNKYSQKKNAIDLLFVVISQQQKHK